ncbi:DUF6414 family protein [Paenisporosarcina indica]|uniref:DUF6414 family protein n=1 Tax=Paenisporosarcina indica TaxID=650093 RepID=UPI0009501E20|nr:DUF6414 family protein [Paenisporosarcina indica]
MKKIVYFDEGSVTDILLVEHGGEIQSIDEDKGTVTLKGNAGVTAEAGAGTGFLNVIKAAFNVNVGASIEANKDSLVTKTLTNTILSDFLDIKQRLISEVKITVLKNYKVYALKNSFAFMKMYAPYLKIFREDTAVVEGLQDFNFREVDEILTAAKGYYELIGILDNKKIVLRFNIQQFKNAYMLTDIPKMDLTYYVIEVGTCKENDLLMEHELAGNDDVPSQEINIDELMGIEDEEDISNLKLKVYDVILAGIGE